MVRRAPKPLTDPDPGASGEESWAEVLLAGAIDRIGADPLRLEQMALLCDLFSQIEPFERRELLLSITAMVALGTPDGQPPAGQTGRGSLS
jgi:hypothetical protein